MNKQAADYTLSGFYNGSIVKHKYSYATKAAKMIENPNYPIVLGGIK